MDDAPVLITGGAGFIGSSLVRHFLREAGSGAVVVADALTYAGHLETLAGVRHAPRFVFEHADVTDGPSIHAILRRYRPRAVFHLAAESHVDRSIDAPAPFVHTNVVGTVTMLDQALRYWTTLSANDREQFRFLHVSTDEVFGALGPDGVFTPDSPYRPTSPYAASKAASDHFARAWHHTYGLPVIVTNCSNNYGPYQYPEKLIPLVVRKALAMEPIPVYGAGDQVRDWLHVEDHVEGLAAAMRHGVPGETYLFGGRSERTNLQVVERICDVVDAIAPSRTSRRSLIRHVADRPGHDFRYAIDPSATEGALGWRALHRLDEGLAATVCWFAANTAWCNTVLGAGYGGERLGLGVASETAA